MRTYTNTYFLSRNLKAINGATAKSPADPPLDVKIFPDNQSLPEMYLHYFRAEPEISTSASGPCKTGLITLNMGYGRSEAGIAAIRVCLLTKVGIEDFELEEFDQSIPHLKAFELRIKFPCGKRRSFSESALQLLDKVLAAFGVPRDERRKMYVWMEIKQETWLWGKPFGRLYWMPINEYFIRKMGLAD